MLEIISLPSMFLAFVFLKWTCASCKRPSLAIAGFGAIIAGAVTFSLTSYSGFDDLSTVTTFGPAAIRHGFAATTYLAAGLIAGFTAGVVALVISSGLKHGSTTRLDFAIPWKHLGVLCCLSQFILMGLAVARLIQSWLNMVQPHIRTSFTEPMAYDYVTMFVFFEVLFVFIPVMLVARVFGHTRDVGRSTTTVAGSNLVTTKVMSSVIDLLFFSGRSRRGEYADAPLKAKTHWWLGLRHGTVATSSAGLARLSTKS